MRGEKSRLGGALGRTAVIFLAAGLGLCGGTSFAEDDEKKSDAYAGKTVADFNFGRNLIANRMKNAPRLGEQAPDFLLLDAESGKEVRLSELCRKKPVVLWFGSSTCGESCRSISPLAELSQRYSDKVQFVLVYIREAHAKDGLGFGPTAYINDPKTFAQRRKVAATWKKREKIPFPVLVDGIEDSMAVRWAGWPVRLYVIDEKQKVVYAGQQGPWYYNPGKWYQHEGMTNLVVDKDWEGISRGSLEDFLESFSKAKSE